MSMPDFYEAQDWVDYLRPMVELALPGTLSPGPRGWFELVTQIPVTSLLEPEGPAGQPARTRDVAEIASHACLAYLSATGLQNRQCAGYAEAGETAVVAAALTRLIAAAYAGEPAKAAYTVAVRFTINTGDTYGIEIYEVEAADHLEAVERATQESRGSRFLRKGVTYGRPCSILLEPGDDPLTRLRELAAAGPAPDGSYFDLVPAIHLLRQLKDKQVEFDARALMEKLVLGHLLMPEREGAEPWHYRLKDTAVQALTHWGLSVSRGVTTWISVDDMVVAIYDPKALYEAATAKQKEAGHE